jgi:hypothetical protein
MYIRPHEAIPAAYFINPFDQWYKHYSLPNFWGKTLIFLVRLHQSSWNLVHASGHVKPSQRRT